MRSPTGGRVLVLGPIPPPVHGAAVVTAAMADWLRQRGAQVEVVDTSADSHGIVSMTGPVQTLRYLLTGCGCICCAAPGCCVAPTSSTSAVPAAAGCTSS